MHPLSTLQCPTPLTPLTLCVCVCACRRCYTQVPYEKGYAFLMWLREYVLDNDIEAIDNWLKSYVKDFMFKCVTYTDMIAHLRKHFEEQSARFNTRLSDVTIKEWLEGEGMPPNEYCPDFSAASELTKPAEKLHDLAINGVHQGTFEHAGGFTSWSTYHKSYVLDLCIKGKAFAGGQAAVLAFGKSCGLHDPPSQNCELSMRWCVLLCKEGVTSALSDIEAHLITTGKQKFTLPVYRALAKAQPRHVFDEFAQSVLAKCRLFLDVQVLKKVEGILAACVAPVTNPTIKKPFAFGMEWANLARGACMGCPKC